jgi:formamidase
VYLILGAAPVDGRLSGVVDVPNSCATLYVPTAIFDIDVRPSARGPQRIDRGQCAVST